MARNEIEKIVKDAILTNYLGCPDDFELERTHSIVNDLGMDSADIVCVECEISDALDLLDFSLFDEESGKIIYSTVGEIIDYAVSEVEKREHS